MKKNFKELIESCDIDAVIKELDLDEAEAKEFFETIKGLEPVEGEKVLIGMPHDEDREVVLFAKGDIDTDSLKGLKIANVKIDDVDGMSGNVAKAILSETKLPKDRPYNYEAWEEILGYEVDEDNVNAYGKIAFVADVIATMTFLAIKKAEFDEIRKVFNESLAMEETKELAKVKLDMSEPGAHQLLVGFGTQDKTESDEISRIESLKNMLRRKIVEYNTLNKTV